MPNQFAYIATSSPQDDSYIRMLQIALTAARIVHPEARRIVFADEDSMFSYPETLEKVENLSNEIYSVACPYDSAVDRSRYLKTTLRDRLEGEFLFLDGDAIPLCIPSSLDRVEGDVAMALDLNQPAHKYRIHDRVRDLHTKMGWPSPRRYFNSGVMLWRDTPGAHRLAKTWHEKWCLTQAAGCHKDQPSLNVAIQESDCSVAELKPKYNAMVERESWGRCKPSILHFLKWKPDGDTVFCDLMRNLELTGRVDTRILRELIRTGYPWIDKDSPSRQLAAGHPMKALWAGSKRLFIKSAKSPN